MSRTKHHVTLENNELVLRHSRKPIVHQYLFQGHTVCFYKDLTNGAEIFNAIALSGTKVVRSATMEHSLAVAIINSEEKLKNIKAGNFYNSSAP